MDLGLRVLGCFWRVRGFRVLGWAFRVLGWGSRFIGPREGLWVFGGGENLYGRPATSLFAIQPLCVCILPHMIREVRSSN